ncbi:MAG: hypothetical protein HZB56_06930 [Deltaproteobacteria bacterium]|nr:hypothetical protein [Deltaproteobacteria bacterium]
MKKRTFPIVGAGFGIAAFLAIGLLPSLVYGGYAGIVLAGALFGTPVASTLAVRILAIVGMVMGVVGVGALFAVGGAALGAGVEVLVGAGGREPSADSRKL